MKYDEVLMIVSTIIECDNEIESFTIERLKESKYTVSISKSDFSVVETFTVTNQEEVKLFFIQPMIKELNRGNGNR